MENITRLPNGLSSMGSPVTGGAYVTTGSVFFVDSLTGLDSNSGQDPDHAFATLDHAVGHCTSGVGDTIFVMPNHAENVTSDADVALDVSGISVIGLGRGETRPTFTFTQTASQFELDAHSIYIENLLFKSGIDAVVNPIIITAPNCTIVNCEYKDSAASNFEATDIIVMTSSGDYTTIDGFKYHLWGGSSGGTQNDSVINIYAAAHVTIKNCYLSGKPAVGLIEGTSETENVWIHNNILENATKYCIAGGTKFGKGTNSAALPGGIISDNLMTNTTEVQSDEYNWGSSGMYTWNFANFAAAGTGGAYDGKDGALWGSALGAST